MIVVVLLLGAFLGGVVGKFPGALAGALFGYVLWSFHSNRTRLATLEREVQELRQQMDRNSHPLPSGAPAVSGNDESPATKSEPLTAAQTESQPPPEEQSTVPEWAPDWPELPEEAPAIHASTEQERPPSLEGFLEPIQRFLTGGSLLVKVGVVILFVGISFLVKYAAEHSLLPIELRLAGSALAGIVLLVVGWRLRARRAAYAHALQGGGIGIIYLTTFAAFRLYALIAPTFAFAVLVAVATISATLAVLQDTRSLAVLAASGGFLAPVLASTGAGSHVALFGYYALLNLGIAGIAWFRAWRILNLIGFAFTFIIGTFWGWNYYQPEYFTTTEPFLILFFLLYTCIALLFALRHPPNLKGYLDGTLVFGTPIVASALQAMLVKQFPFGLAWSALGLGLFYLPLSWLLFRKRPLFMRTLAEAFFAFGVIFATLAIPLAFDGRWTSATWALEGAALIWAGARQGRQSARALGMMLQFGAGIAFLLDMHGTAPGLPILNGLFLGTTLVALAGSFSAYILHRHKQEILPWESLLGAILLTWGLIWWLLGGLAEIERHGAEGYRTGIILAFLAATALSCDILERKLPWPAMAWPALSLLPMLVLCALAGFSHNLHPLADGGFIGWPLALAVLYLTLHRHESLPDRPLGFLHSGALWLLAGLLCLELAWQLDHWIEGSPVWPLIAWGLVPSLLVLLVSVRAGRAPWPLQRHGNTFLSLGSAPLVVIAWAWSFYVTMKSSGNPAPLRYIPLLNPLDVTFATIAVILPLWVRRLAATFPDFCSSQPVMRGFCAGYCATLFFWLNGILARTVHHWAGVRFSFPALFHSVLFQAVLSIFWSLLALCIMVFATRKGIRSVWLTGAGLLALVVVKLFAVDLSGTGTVARIVSFVGVGILLLVIGYFSPAPPRSPEDVQQ